MQHVVGAVPGVVDVRKAAKAWVNLALRSGMDGGHTARYHALAVT